MTAHLTERGTTAPTVAEQNGDQKVDSFYASRVTLLSEDSKRGRAIDETFRIASSRSDEMKGGSPNKRLETDAQKDARGSSAWR